MKQIFSLLALVSNMKAHCNSTGNKTII